MAGSLSYRKYTSDSGTAYSIKIDESNASAIPTSGVATELCPERTANDPAIPTGLVKRYILCQVVSNPKIRRKFYVGNPAAIPSLIAPGATIESTIYPGLGDTTGTTVTWAVTAYRGEKSKTIPAFTALDTGLTDGDVAQ